MPEHDLTASPAYRAALAAPPDDEPVTAGDARAIEETAAKIRAGKVVAHEDSCEFGLGRSSFGRTLRDPSCAPLGELKALKGRWQGYFRLRAGDYRAIFSVTPDEITIDRVRHRSDVYR
jgi:hypothetical protein